MGKGSLNGKPNKEKPNGARHIAYVSGLLQAAGFDNLPTPTHKVPGWDKPVPEEFFKGSIKLIIPEDGFHKF